MSSASISAVVAAGTDNLTISAIAEGDGTVTVTATDILNDSRTVEIEVHVNPVFMAGAIADAELNVGGSAATYVVDLLDVFDGGTPPVGYAVANDNPGSATDVIVGNTLTVTAVAPGTVNIDVTGTDLTLADATSSFTVTVNAAVAGSPIAGVDLKEDDAAHEVDLSAVFSGGDGNYTYAVSTDATHIDASESGGTLSASVVTAFAAGTTIGTIDVDIVATDGLGDQAMATLTVDVFPATGNVLGGGPSPADAAATLDHFLGLGAPLTAKQIGAADMNGDALVTPFDAAQNFAAFFSKGEIQAVVANYLEYGEVAQDGAFVEIPLLVVGGDLDDVVSASFEAQLDPEAVVVQGVETDLGDGWLVRHSVDETGLLRIGIAGYGEIGSDGKLATIKLQLLDRGSDFNLSAVGAVNDNEISSIDELEIVELPETFVLQGNYPNPFNPSTTIQFSLPETADVEIQIFDMLGRRAMVIPSQSIEAGANRSIQLNASALASGSYFYRVIARMDSKTLVESGRMMLVK